MIKIIAISIFIILIIAAYLLGARIGYLSGIRDMNRHWLSFMPKKEKK